jgi:hypothetical protein
LRIHPTIFENSVSKFLRISYPTSLYSGSSVKPSEVFLKNYGIVKMKPVGSSQKLRDNSRIFSKSLGQTSQKLWDKDRFRGEVFLKNYGILQVRRETARGIVPGGNYEKVLTNTHKSNQVNGRGNPTANRASW